MSTGARLPEAADFAELERRAGHVAVVRCAADIAELALPAWTAMYPDDDRPAAAIQAARAWADDPSDAAEAEAAEEAAVEAWAAAEAEAEAEAAWAAAAAWATVAWAAEAAWAARAASRAAEAGVPVADIRAVYDRHMEATRVPTPTARPVRSLAQVLGARR